MKETITTCDRCGRPINQPELQSSCHINVSKYQDAREYDLCSPCTSHLIINFMTANASKKGIIPDSQQRRDVGE